MSAVAYADPVPFMEVLRSFTESTEIVVPELPQPDDIIEFVVSDRFLDKGYQLYPRQATLLKVIFLNKEALTDYDYDVLGEWAEGFRMPDPDRWLAEHAQGDDHFHFEGMHGIQPDWEDRMDALIAEGRPWFREVDAVIGRRGSKGYMGGICAARVLYHHMSYGDPQEHFGIERNKRLSMFVFAAKKEQARDNQWRDVYQVITGAPCFQPFISRPLAESLTLYSPKDKAVMDAAIRRGQYLKSSLDTATFEILPKESTTVSGRGPASFLQMYDEMAHVVKGVARADAGAVYEQATPSLDTFGHDAFIYAASSPWTMTGKFFENTQQALELDPYTLKPMYPEMLITQLTSWDPYEDYERAHELPVRPGRKTTFNFIRTPIQAYNDQMKRLERANRDTFRVERLSYWATVLDAYLDLDQVEEVFGPWDGRELEMTDRGILSVPYIAHGDPSVSGANFGFAIAHAEGPDQDGLLHVVFDLIHNWSPSDFPESRIDYLKVQEDIQGFIDRFVPVELTFDQFNSVSLIQRLQSYVGHQHYPRRVEIYERTATHAENWKVAETFKTAINMGLVHAPHHDLGKQELKFLQKTGPSRVDHPTMGPVQTKDVADAMMQVTHALIGDQITAYLERLGAPIRGDQGPGAFSQRVVDPDEDVFRSLGRSGLHGRGDPTPVSRIRRGGYQRRRTPRGLR